jgi:hypothetical protein
VRYADHNIATKITALLNVLQVQQGRLRKLISEYSKTGTQKLPEREGVDAIIDAAKIHAKTAELFDYAGDIDKVRRRVPKKDLVTAVHLSGLYDDDHPALQRISEMPGLE